MKMMKGNCTDSGKRVKQAVKAAGAGKQKPDYKKQLKKEEKGYA